MALAHDSARDCEQLTKVAETLILIAAAATFVRRRD